MVKYNVCIYPLMVNFKDLFDDVHVIFFFMIFLIKVYVMGTHLNCMSKLMQFK